MARQHAGFALIEIAVVIVITGLLMGWVMKGQELVTSARVRNLIAHHEAFKTPYRGFYDRYRALPGDYKDGAASIAGVTGCGGSGDGDGRIQGAPGCENMLDVEHLY